MGREREQDRRASARAGAPRTGAGAGASGAPRNLAGGAEGLERVQTEMSAVKQVAERLREECQQLAEDLESGREERVEVQRRAEWQEQELARLEHELRRSQAELNHRKRAADPDKAAEKGAGRPWWRRPLLVGRLAPRNFDRVVHLHGGGLEHAGVLSRTPRHFGRSRSTLKPADLPEPYEHEAARIPRRP